MTLINLVHLGIPNPYHMDMFKQRKIQDFPEGAPIYYLAKICQKLHENEENWTGGTHPKFYYVDPPLLSIHLLATRWLVFDRKVFLWHCWISTYLRDTVLFSAHVYATITSHVSSYAAEPRIRIRESKFVAYTQRQQTMVNWKRGSYQVLSEAFEPNIYRTQTKFAKVLFLHVSVSHSVHRGVVSQHALQVSRPTPRVEVDGSGLGRSPGPHLGGL